MTANPLFSVLIAQYNNGKYLDEAIDSVRAQTYANWEIILVDDFSADNSRDLYKNYANDERIKIFYNEKNKGCGYTKRRCAELANGEICGFLDPDDALLPHALQSMMNVHTENQDVALVFSRHYLCDNHLQKKSESRLLRIAEGKSYFTNKDYSPEHFVSFKKKFYDKTAGISPNYQLGIDQDLYFKMEEVGDVYVLDEFTYMYRISTTSISFANIPKSHYWNVIVRHDTCIRRGLNPSDYPLVDCLDYIAILENRKLINSKAYRLGKLILKPFSILRKVKNTQ